MSGATQIQRAYPWVDYIDGHEVTFRLMAAGDHDGILSFANRLNPDDLMFLRLDITQSTVVDEWWIAHILQGRTLTVLACINSEIVGYGNLHLDEASWTRHLGQIRILVHSDWRKLGLGRKLAIEVFQLAREKKIDRIFAQMAADQPRVRQLFENLGFRAEALLTDWVMDRDGRTHDLLVMSHHVDDFGS